MSRRDKRHHHRLERNRPPGAAADSSREQNTQPQTRNAIIDCGWGRLIFGQTFDSNQAIVDILRSEGTGRRDIVLYLRDPHVVISLAPQEVFLDPSNTYRLWLDRYHASRRRPKGFSVYLLNKREDADAIHNLYLRRHMVPPDAEFIWKQRKSRTLTYLVAVDDASREVIGAVIGVDHVEAFQDAERGSSLWALAVDPQAPQPGVGETLVRQLAEHYQVRGLAYMDLSVLYDNQQAIRLYEKLGFERIPVFAVKHKNAFNEPLFVGKQAEDALNPYARIIVREARRRGILVEILDPEGGFFELSLGGRSIVCRESLSELTTAIAMSRCDDKAVTHRVLNSAGLHVPRQCRFTDLKKAMEFLNVVSSLVVKPARGEQGAGISVDISHADDLEAAIGKARKVCDNVLLEEFVTGQDLRVIVIGDEVVAAAVRRPARIIGNGVDTVEQLIKRQSRRRAAATGGESKIPLDSETQRCIKLSGYQMDSVLPEGEKLFVRKTANLHTGGTIHNVTDQLSPAIAQAARDAAKALDIPVTGLDFLVSDVSGDQYVIIEANERPGLANHEPQPTAERFIDLLFPQTIQRERRT
jgi:GNAT-family acetyltransferase (TIGR03103 family)